MWDRVDELLARAPDEDALRLHRVELLEARRRRAIGLDAGGLGGDEAAAILCELAAMSLLARVRELCDGPLVIHKGPEIALDYPGPRLRRYWDLDLIAGDARGAQAALLAAGFQELDEEESEHHLRPLRWPGLPVCVELHTASHWVERLPRPGTDELIASAVPSRLGIEGIDAPAPAQHALLLAVHAWSHEPLGRLGNLLDVAVALGRADEAEVAALARRWGCARMWRTTRAAIGALLEGSGRSAAVTLWARHLHDVRERSVLEWHVKSAAAPVWGLPPARVPAALAAELRATIAPTRDGETWAAKARRARLAVRNAGTKRSHHDLALEARGRSSIHGQEAA